MVLHTYDAVPPMILFDPLGDIGGVTISAPTELRTESQFTIQFSGPIIDGHDIFWMIVGSEAPEPEPVEYYSVMTTVKGLCGIGSPDAAYDSELTTARESAYRIINNALTTHVTVPLTCVAS